MRKRAYASFAELPDSHREFLDGNGGSRYFHCAHWYEAFSRTGLESDAKVSIFAVESDDHVPVPLALLVTRSPAGQNGSTLADRRPGPDTLASLTSTQSVFFAPRLAGGTSNQRRDLLRELVSAMCTLGRRWAVIDLDHLDDAAFPVEQLVEALRDAGLVAQAYVYRVNLYERVAGKSFEEYLATRPSILRHTYRRKARKLERSRKVDFRILRDEAEVADAIADYRRVRSRSWKEAEPFPEHTGEQIKASAAAGALRLGMLYLDDVPVATQLWFVMGGSATIYKLHYDQSLRKESVGSVLTLRMLEHVIDVEHVEEIDFGVGGEEAKRPWLSTQRPLYGVLAFDPRTASGMRALLRHRAGLLGVCAKTGLKRLIRSARNLAERLRKR